MITFTLLQSALFLSSITCIAALNRRPTDRVAAAKERTGFYAGQKLMEIEICNKEEATALRAVLERNGCRLIDDEGRGRELRHSSCTKRYSACSPAGALEVISSHRATVVSDDIGRELLDARLNIQDWTEPDDGILSKDFYLSYRNYDSMEERLSNVAKMYPDVATYGVLSKKSIEGRAIRSITVQGANWTKGAARVVVTCQLHAREWIAGMACVYLAETAAGMAQSDPSWMQGAQLVVVPIVNPDGFVFSGNLEEGDRFWRKNRNANGGNQFGYCVGVDLNRNFDVDFAGKESTTDDECDIEYHGVAKRSEPEAQAVSDLLLASETHVHLDVHTFGCDILGPWGYTNSKFGDSTADELGKSIMDAMRAKADTDYDYGSGGAVTYLASGLLADYSSSLGALGYTIELPPCSLFSGLEGFAPNEDVILPAAEELFAGAKVVLDAARQRASA